VATSDTEIANQALLHLGVSKEISNLTTEQSREANICRRFYTLALEEILSDFRWPFATRIQRLNKIRDNPNVDWGKEYRYPPDAHVIRRIVTGNRNETHDQGVPFRVASDAAGRVIWTDQTDADVEYTIKVTDVLLFPPSFVASLSYLLGMKIAPALTQGDPFKRAEYCAQMYGFELKKAQSNDKMEEQRDAAPHAEWDRARGGGTTTRQDWPTWP